MRRGLVESRQRAQEVIGLGLVLVAGAPADKPARMVHPGEPIAIAGPRPRYVSRGGDKLAAALDRFGIGVQGRRAIDAGASTGGFTDCLLQRGASQVVAVDVGRGQLHERLVADPRVRSLERRNLRHLSLEDTGGVPFERVVADLSFISLRTVAEVLVTRLPAPGADLVVLVKPQFEAGRAEASRGHGVIRDPEVWTEALRGACSAISERGAAMMGAMVSPLTGADGNVEFFVHFRIAAPDATAAAGTIDDIVAEAAARHGSR